MIGLLLVIELYPNDTELTHKKLSVYKAPNGSVWVASSTLVQWTVAMHDNHLVIKHTTP